MKLADIDVQGVAERDPALARALLHRQQVERNFVMLERRRQAKTGENSADKIADALLKGIEKMSGLRKDLEEAGPVVDLEGTKATFADRHGSYADNAVQAKRGGIGVVDSNTDPDAPDMSHGQGPGHDHPDLRGPTEEEAERAAKVVRNEPVDLGERVKSAAKNGGDKKKS